MKTARVDISAWMEHHVNRVPWRGILTLVDVPSEHSPHGARGRCVLLTRDAAERSLSSLLGMGLSLTENLEGHDTRMKVGIITSAFIHGHRLVVAGHIFAKDFPDTVRRMHLYRGMLGMSYDVSNALVADTYADTWVINKVTFTGAAIMLRSKAAYPRTLFRLEVPDLEMKGMK